MGEVTRQAVEPLSALHDIQTFRSGVDALDRWLHRRAMASQNDGTARTFVLIEEGRVAGYYALAAGAVSHSASIGRLRRNAPDPVPMVILARLAVSSDRQGMGFGAALVRDAVLRSLQAAGLIGIRGMLVHAKSHNAREFYLRLGFKASPVDDLILMTPLAGLIDP